VSKRKASRLSLLGLACLLLALVTGIHGLGLGLTAGDGMFEPPQVCNQECQDEWRRMADEGGRWMIAGAVLFGSGIVVGSLVWRAYRSQELGVTAEPSAPPVSDNPMR
jgi:hypothetical protein